MVPENWQYHHTVCPDGWTPHNGFCHRVLPVEEAGSWEESSQACLSHGAHLSSLHSLSHVELLLNLMANCKSAPSVSQCPHLHPELRVAEDSRDRMSCTGSCTT